MDDRHGPAKRFAEDVLRRSVTKIDSDGRKAGFVDAAEIALNMISIKVEALKNQVRQGSQLSDRDTFMLVELNELKEQIESDFDYYWKEEDFAWRGAMPS